MWPYVWWHGSHSSVQHTCSSVTHMMTDTRMHTHTFFWPEWLQWVSPPWGQWDRGGESRGWGDDSNYVDDDDVTHSPARSSARLTAAVRPLCNLSLNSGHKMICLRSVGGRGWVGSTLSASIQSFEWMNGSFISKIITSNIHKEVKPKLMETLQFIEIKRPCYWHIINVLAFASLILPVFHHFSTCSYTVIYSVPNTKISNLVNMCKP